MTNQWNPASSNPSATGVSSYNARTGAVVPGNADYLAVKTGGLTGAVSATRYVGGTATVAPTTGTFNQGDFVISQNGKVWICTVAGTPGTWVDPSAGGGSVGVQVATVTVTSAQIKQLHTTPVTLVTVTAGNVAIVTGVGIVYLAGATPYLDGGGSMTVLSGLGGAAVDWADQAGAGFWDQATSQVSLFGISVNSSDNPLASFGSRDVILTQSAANPTLGDGTLVVTVAYFLAPSA